VGYPRVNLFDRGNIQCRLVHVLVARAFLGQCPEGHEINHKDGNRVNAALSNLEYITRSANKLHALDVLGGRASIPKGSQRTWKAVLHERDIPVIRALHKAGISQKELGIKYGVTAAAIYAVVRGITWKHVA
jgi:hypothetical protein